MNKIKENKKLFVVIVIISLLAILLGSYAIYKNSYKTEKTAKFEKVVDKLTSKNTDLSKVTKVEGRLIDKTTGKSVKGVKLVKNSGKTSGSGNEITLKSENTSKSTPTATKPSTSSSSGAANTKPSPKPKEKTKVWIVDKPAWTETVVDYDRPVETWIAVDEGSGIERKFYDYDEAMSEKGFLESGLGHVYNGETEYPYTKTITHPEEGHWEYR